MKVTGCPDEDDWALFEMGALDAEKRAEMNRHLQSGCGACRVAQKEWSDILPMLALSAPERHPSPGVERRLQARLFGNEFEKPLRPAQAVGTRSRRVMAWGLAAVLALAIYATVESIERNGEVSRLQGQNQQLKAQVALLDSEVRRAQTSVPPKLSPGAPQVEPKRQVERQLPPSPDSSLALSLAQAQQEKSLAEKTAADLNARIAVADRDRQNLQAHLDDLRAKLQDLENRNRQLEQVASEASKSAAEQTEEIAKLRSEVRNHRAERSDYDRLLAVIASGPFRSVELRAVDSGAGHGSARAVVSAKAGLFLVAQKLPVLPDGKCYQLWLIRKANPSIVSGGIMQTEANGLAVLADPNLSGTDNITGLAITDEPTGGSVAAKGHKLLFGAF
jgi:anti-sigma-K factor RskA